MKRISVLGSTGSIGTQTLSVIEHHPESFVVEALAAGRNAELLLKQAHQFKPRLVSVQDKVTADAVKDELPSGTKLVYGEEGLIEAASCQEADTVVTAVVGSVGLKSTLAAIEEGKTIGLANKETLVTAGHLVTAAAKRKGVKLMPIDSEHSAIFQSLNGESMSDVDSITITASGGSFRDRTREQLAHVTVEEALKHPNWSMGAKITIDSATMANKGLEVIEAHWLFELDYDRIHVLIHPESIIHSYVEYVDGSIIAQLGVPDMRVPIQYALSYPERMTSPAERLNLAKIAKLHFRELDTARYPMVRYAYESGRIGGTATTVFNAANEVAVARFLQGEIAFLDIERIVENALAGHRVQVDPSLEIIEETDREIRQAAQKF
ncbi:1-deoxy-D-xylulose-5-phosphate reductoisomerase [Paenibacillus aquistagni]|uniref:1-deoxy-D-xylulose 5-phosphate reductoisomerase n=1 Tax=Paenibacillus aquistagni TaxID=1852522 RepID=A0A1X7INN0_9BACL|nr:1-deoxy-D-xylulose-5-phosphate reductoisomerase [Paenibacillus aquistagni]NMM51208.1 1-deoxy-D-xylulose-5-phosphate reductoisomerase [Paenibacillus aquistagni]SMG16623.1 1-deoxy-D-xylulose 5-phosphate reductoisomerase [Paenibacillus aquistagni]